MLRPLLTLSLLALTGLAWLGPMASAQIVEAEETVSMDFRGPELQVVLDAVSDLTGKRFLYTGGGNSYRGQAVGKQEVWFRCPLDVPLDRVYNVFQLIMQHHGYVLLDRGDLVEVVAIDRAASKTARTVTMRELEDVKGDMEFLTLIYAFEHVTDGLRVQQQLRTIAPGSADGLMILGVQNMPFIMVTGFAPTVYRIGKICEQIDQPPAPPHVEVLALKHAEADAMVALLRQVLGGGQEGYGGPALEVAADTRTNSLVLSGQPRMLDQAKTIIAALDVPTPEGRVVPTPEGDEEEGEEAEEEARDEE